MKALLVSPSITITVLPLVTPAVSISNTDCATGNILFTAALTNGGATPAVQWHVNNAFDSPLSSVDTLSFNFLGGTAETAKPEQ